MAIAVWQPDYATGDAQIDGQHQHLFTLLNQLAAALEQDNSSAVLNQCLNELVEETQIHFKTEEKLMGSLGYAGYLCHRAAHDNLCRELQKVVTNVELDPTFLTLAVVQTVKDLTLQHICEQDLPMMQALKELQEAATVGV